MAACAERSRGPDRTEHAKTRLDASGLCALNAQRGGAWRMSLSVLHGEPLLRIAARGDPESRRAGTHIPHPASASPSGIGLASRASMQHTNILYRYDKARAISLSARQKQAGRVQAFAIFLRQSYCTTSCKFIHATPHNKIRFTSTQTPHNYKPCPVSAERLPCTAVYGERATTRPPKNLFSRLS